MKRIGNMSRDEMEKEARTQFDLDSYKAARALAPISDEMLKEMLQLKRKGTFDATLYFNRSGKRWVADLDSLEEAIREASKGPQKAGSRPGWTPERRAKTLATKAAKRAAREKEVTDLRNEVSRLEMEVIEAEALIVKQKEEIENLQAEAYGAVRTVPGGSVMSELQEIKSAMRDFGQILVSAGAALAAKPNQEAARLATEVALNPQWMKIENPPVESAETNGLDAAVETISSTLSEEPIEVTHAVKVKSSEEPLESMSVFALNKKAAELRIPADVNKDRLIDRIRSAMGKE